MGKYDGKDFNDPVVRCFQCAKLVHRAFIDKHGGCNHCGNKRFKNVAGLSTTEYYELKRGVHVIGIESPYEIDADFLALFEEAEEVSSE